MINSLSSEQQKLHLRAMDLSRKHRRIESDLILVLQEIDSTKLFKKMGYASLFLYAVEALGLTESIAYSFISVSRKMLEVSKLKDAVLKQTLSVAKASRLVAALNPENATTLIEFAKTHSTRDTEREVAKIRPRSRAPDRAVILAADLIKLEMTVQAETFAKLKRVQSLLANINQPTSFKQVLDVALNEYLKQYDPVVKANRALEKQKIQNYKFCARRKIAIKKSKQSQRLKTTNKPKFQRTIAGPRVPFTAQEKHEVFLRDGGRCTHIDSAGKRCSSDRWVQIHHLKPVSLGGSNDPANLTLLCSFHHDQAHQLSLPLEGQINWLKSPQTRYALAP